MFCGARLFTGVVFGQRFLSNCEWEYSDPMQRGKICDPSVPPHWYMARANQHLWAYEPAWTSPRLQKELKARKRRQRRSSVEKPKEGLQALLVSAITGTVQPLGNKLDELHAKLDELHARVHCDQTFRTFSEPMMCFIRRGYITKLSIEMWLWAVSLWSEQTGTKRQGKRKDED